MQKCCQPIFEKNIIWLHTKYDYDYFNEFVLLSPNITVQNIISEKNYVSVFLERKKETIIETSKQKKKIVEYNKYCAWCCMYYHKKS